MAGDGPLPKPHGKYNAAVSVSRSLKRLGFAQFTVRKGVAWSGFKCKWVDLPSPGHVTVRWQPDDDMSEAEVPEERRITLDVYMEALRKDGYAVERQPDFLLVMLKKDTAPQPPAVEEATAPELDLGQPVKHEVTGKLVGWIRDGKFIDAE